MSNDQKSRLAKLLDSLDVIELKLPEKCVPLVEEFRSKYGAIIADEVEEENMEEFSDNPYVPDQAQLDDIDKKIMMIISERKELKETISGLSTSCPDPKRPWRIYTCKEKLLRVDNELKRHHEKSTELIKPPTDDVIDALVKGHSDTGDVDRARVQESVESAKKSLPNFQYRKISATDSSETDGG